MGCNVDVGLHWRSWKTRGLIACFIILIATVLSAQAFVPNDPMAVPSIAIIGAVKGGTTDMWFMLTSSPAAPPAERIVQSPVKEVCDLMRSTHELVISAPHRRHIPQFNLPTYLQRLRHPCAAAAEPLTCIRSSATAAGLLTLDACPTYMKSKAAWPSRLLHAMSPNTKIIAMLRDPTERARSNHNHWENQSLLGAFKGKSFEAVTASYIAWVQQAAGVAHSITLSTPF